MRPTEIFFVNPAALTYPSMTCFRPCVLSLPPLVLMNTACSSTLATYSGLTFSM